MPGVEKICFLRLSFPFFDVNDDDDDDNDDDDHVFEPGE